MLFSNGTPKMDELKPISHEQFNQFRNDYMSKDLKAKFDFNSV